MKQNQKIKITISHTNEFLVVKSRDAPKKRKRMRNIYQFTHGDGVSNFNSSFTILSNLLNAMARSSYDLPNLLRGYNNAVHDVIRGLHPPLSPRHISRCLCLRVLRPVFLARSLESCRGDGSRGRTRIIRSSWSRRVRIRIRVRILRRFGLSHGRLEEETKRNGNETRRWVEGFIDPLLFFF